MDGRFLDILTKALENLNPAEVKKFKIKLRNVELRGGYANIPTATLQQAEPMEVGQQMLKQYGADYALEVAIDVLEKINVRGVAHTLKKDADRVQQRELEVQKREQEVELREQQVQLREERVHLREERALVREQRATVREERVQAQEDKMEIREQKVQELEDTVAKLRAKEVQTREERVEIRERKVHELEDAVARLQTREECA
ncbi:golgin subfamily A member 6-like protein 6 isoform X2 [Microcaecilia unicolor]|uniref:Golgin subfamily A member 6-like protein 6 isoform X2 n=1 Tax=Microcaecilia unicolor TaxID=1415580 RepID=A0A6P7ZLV1_9AMPH|nr:golgin subfamily A member 6-like protein 6 isoform X2 [Microcaecilia unicolor]